VIIKAISLWEPHATAMDLDLKLNETRSFTLSYRGPLAIHHARKRFVGNEYGPDFVMQLGRDGVLSQLCYGVIKSVVEWYDSQPTHVIRGKLSERELFYGNYDDKRFAWLTRNRISLPTPIPTIGHQGLFDWEVPPEYEHLVAPMLAKYAKESAGLFA